VTLDGKRPLIGEIQSLLARPANPAAPRRAAVSGIDQARVAMIVAVLEKRAMVPIGAMDIYLSTVGGMRLTDPSSDLAVAMAMASAFTSRPLPATTVVIGEVGLAGDLRRVTGMDRRLAEAARLGFTTALVPADCGPAPKGLRTLESATIGAALRAMMSLTESRLRVVPPPPNEDTYGDGWVPGGQ
jgi:DNA repair protein RadA/Sms